MKKTMKFLVPLALGLLIIASIIWYLFIYDRDFTRDTLLQQARYHDIGGNSRLSSWFYDAAYNFSGHDENVAIELANQYKHDGNYTKAEYTLTSAINSMPTVELYTALSRTYVEQDKLMDAVNLLDNLSNPEIKAAIDAQRPAPPEPSSPVGYYSHYIDLQLASPAKYVFYTTNGEYPSINGAVYQGAITLPAGQTTITTVAVSESGLVSPLTTLDYTVTGVIEEITLEDPAMDAAIRALIQADADDLLLSSHLWDITEFTAPAGVKSFADLKYLPNLTKLTIADQTIDTLSHLSSLSKLVVLELTGCKFPTDDLAVLAALPSLSSLTMSGCNLSTIEMLEGAKKLTYLDLSSNTLRNLDVLASMSGTLTELHLQHNAISSLAALSTLEQLVKLNVSFNDLSSLSDLRNCVRLQALEADNNRIQSLDGIEKMSVLSQLSVDHNAITEVSSLAANPELTDLSIASNDIYDITQLGALTKLEVFDFSGNHVEELPQWPDSTPLQTIDGSYNALASLDNLSNLQTLTRVYMDYNLLTDISSLENCFCLVQINVFGNVISDVSMLRERDIIVNYDPTAVAAEE